MSPCCSISVISAEVSFPIMQDPGFRLFHGEALIQIKKP
jgi:hypothetical protein